eukprot:8457347-Pyramimonas_sp.AAC.1
MGVWVAQVGAVLAETGCLHRAKRPRSDAPPPIQPVKSQPRSLPGLVAQSRAPLPARGLTAHRLFVFSAPTLPCNTAVVCCGRCGAVASCRAVALLEPCPPTTPRWAKTISSRLGRGQFKLDGVLHR